MQGTTVFFFPKNSLSVFYLDLEVYLPLQFYWKSQYLFQMGVGTLVL